MEKEFTFRKANGDRIAAKAFFPEEHGKKYATAIFSHGFGSNYRELEHHGPGFVQAGLACVFFDFCGGGAQTKSDRTMREMTVLTEAEDLEAVIAAVKTLAFVDPARIVLVGESMGGFVSALVAARKPEEVQRLVLWYPAFIIPEDARARDAAGKTTALGMPISPAYNRTAMEIDIYGEIEKYKKPVKIIHGDEDPIVPLRYSEEALKHYENASLRVLPGAGHGFDGADSVTARELTVEFLGAF